MSVPSNITCPAAFGMSPAIASTLVVLPAPFGPNKRDAAALGQRQIEPIDADHGAAGDPEASTLPASRHRFPFTEIDAAHARIVDHRSTFAFGDDLAFAHDRDAFAQRDQKADVVLDDDHGDAEIAIDREQQLAQALGFVGRNARKPARPAE